MNIFQSIIFGIVEGITEFLPVSSTAHLDIARVLMQIQATSFIKSFEIAIQFGAILAVVWLYRQKIFSSFSYIKNIAIAFIPTGIIGFVLYKIIKSFLLGNILIEASMLVVGGVVIVLFEKFYEKKIVDSDKRSIEELSAKELLIMGTTQALAVIPGTSRSLTVILSGRSLKISRALVTEFSFLLAIPTMLSATAYDLYKSGFAFGSGDWSALSTGFIVSAVVAFFSVKWLISYIQKNSFSIFGWYRILLGVLVLIFFT